MPGQWISTVLRIARLIVLGKTWVLQYFLVKPRSHLLSQINNRENLVFFHDVYGVDNNVQPAIIVICLSCAVSFFYPSFYLYLYGGRSQDMKSGIWYAASQVSH